MKLDLIQIIKTGDISPLFWGCTDKDIIALFPEAGNLINNLKTSQCPYLILNHVELYFKEDYSGLNQIIIKNWSIERKQAYKFIDVGWLHSKCNYQKVRKKFYRKNWEHKVHKDPYPFVKCLSTVPNVSLVFDSDSKDELQKIYISPIGSSII